MPTDPPNQKPAISESVWQSLRAALEGLIAEARPAASAGGAASDELKKSISDVVGAVLLDGAFIEKCLLRALGGLSGDALKKVCEKFSPREEVDRSCQEAFKTMTNKHLVPAFQNEIKSVVASQIAEFGKTEEFKSLIDSRFRMMDTYMRTEVIPKAVERCLQKSS